MPHFPWEVFAVSFPVFAMVLVAIALFCYKIEELFKKPKQLRHRRMNVVKANAIIGLTFLPFASMYRPSMIETAKVQLRQEDKDEDESGDPESPLKHLLRQLRRIRRGEDVGILSLRLEYPDSTSVENGIPDCHYHE